jgi:AcrR family transcriptional regulator
MDGGLRERKRSKNRDAIVAAALALFRERGFEATTADDIAAAAEVSRRTFFRYFPTKEAVVFPHEGERFALFADALRARPSDETAWQSLSTALLVLAREYMRDRERILEQERLVQSSPGLVAKERLLDLRWEEVVARALGGGRRERLLAGGVIGVVRSVLREWAAGGGQADLEGLGREALDLLAPMVETAGRHARTRPPTRTRRKAKA